MKRVLKFFICVILIAVVWANIDKITDTVEGVIDAIFVSELDRVTDEKIDLGSKYKNHFDTLTSEQKRGYNQILTKLLTAEERFPESIEVPLMSSEELSETFQAVIYDNPTVIAIGRDNQILTSDKQCFFQPNYSMTPAKQREMNQQLDLKINEIISQISEDATEFEKELFIHDYIVNNCVYDDKVLEKSSTAYSCIVEGFSACEGYSKAAKLLFEKAGIECYTISGDAVNFEGKTEGHMWNIVNIDDEYYHFDVTWDDPTMQDGMQTISHIYMNVSEKTISADHSNFSSPVACESEKANYFNKTDSVIYSLKNAQLKKIEKMIAQSDGRSVEIKFSDKTVYDKGVKYLIDRGKVYNIIENVNKTYGKKYNTNSIRYIEEKDKQILTLLFD